MRLELDSIDGIAFLRTHRDLDSINGKSFLRNPSPQIDRKNIAVVKSYIVVSAQELERSIAKDLNRERLR